MSVQEFKLSEVVLLKGIWHFSFTVSDLDRSVAFYRDLLGLEVVHRQRGANPYTRKLVGYPDADIRVAMLRLPGSDTDFG